MPRKARIDASGAIHHIIARGIDRNTIFQDDYDRKNFIDRLATILNETKTVCYAWALIPNHFHLLLRTGLAPVATVMRRLLTGYAMSYNRRHQRHGHLFQNRYKSILCQEDTYLLELVRYIHLNPLRAGIVNDLKALDRFHFAGHSVIMGKRMNDWQDVNNVLCLFDTKVSIARRRYRSYVKKGIPDGKRTDLTGGGLIRSVGGWSEAKAMRRAGVYQKGDERILGDGDFVNTVLKAAQEELDKKYSLQARGFDLDKVVQRVSHLLGIEPRELWIKGKYPQVVQARSLLCYWAVRELGMRMSELSHKLKLSQPAVSLSVKRGEKIAKENQYSLLDDTNL